MNVAQSSHVQGYGYDDSTQTLTVQFTDGSTYQYYGVPRTVYDTMHQSNGMGAGAYFRAKVKDVYSYQKIVDRPRRG